MAAEGLATPLISDPHPLMQGLQLRLRSRFFLPIFFSGAYVTAPPTMMSYEVTAVSQRRHV